MKIGRSILCFIAMLVAACETHRSSFNAYAYDAQTTVAIDNLFARFNGNQPGCALGIYEYRGRRYLQGYGVADISKGVAIAPNTVFAIASVSKQFTAAAVLLLVRRHKLSLDESIRSTIPELPQTFQSVTLRHLLTHTSGLPEYEDIYNRKGGPDYDSASRADQLQTIIDGGGPQFRPGTAAKYANTNYLLAALAVERVSGMPLQRFAQTHIFGPLRMNSSRYVAAVSDIHRLRALPYEVNAAGGFQSVLYGAQLGPTGVQTTVVDLEAWADNFYRAKVGGNVLLAQMQATEFLNDGTPISFALGLERKRLGGYDAVLHTGVTAGTRAAFVRFPLQSTTVSLLCNRIDVNTERVVVEIATILFR